MQRGGLREMGKVVVLGSLNMDVSLEVDRMPVQGETIEGKELILNPGGKGANQAVASANMGSETVMIGSVGDDYFGAELLESLEDAGVGTAFIKKSKGTSTGAAVVIRSAGDNRIIINHGANHVLDFTEVSETLSATALSGDILLTQLECSPHIVWKAIKQAHEQGMFIILNPSPIQKIPPEIYPLLDVLCLNESECAAITGLEQNEATNNEESLKMLANQGVKSIVLTLGSHGSIAHKDGSYIRVPAAKVYLVDSTGAGDTFVGTLAALLAQGESFKEVLDVSSQAAALTTTRIGAQCSIPTLRDVQKAFGRRN